MQTNTFKIGDYVSFGRTRGEQTLASVIKVNQKSIKVKTLTGRGKKSPAGAEWRVAPSLCTLVAPTDPRIKRALEAGLSQRSGARKGTGSGFLFEYYQGLVGGRIVEAGMGADGFPYFILEAGGVERKIEISQDQEGNGPGFLFGLEMPK